MVTDNKWNGNGMEMEWKWNGNGMEMEWKWNGNGMEMEWKQTDFFPFIIFKIDKNIV